MVGGIASLSAGIPAGWSSGMSGMERGNSTGGAGCSCAIGPEIGGGASELMCKGNSASSKICGANLLIVMRPIAVESS